MTVTVVPSGLIRYGESFASQAAAAIADAYSCVKFGLTANAVEATAGLGDIGVGFIEEPGGAIALGDLVTVYTSGRVWVRVAAPVALDAYLAPTALGRVVTANAGDNVVARALMVALSIGQLIPAEITFFVM